MKRGPDADSEGEGRAAEGEGEGDRDDLRLRRRIEQLVPDLVKRTFSAGLAALFSTEEGIRKLATDFQLPKEVAAYLIHQAATSKDELFKVFGRELHNFFQNVNVSGEMQKLLTSLSFEIKTEIRFIPNAEAMGGVKPNIKNDVAMKRSRRERSRDEPPEGGEK